MKIFAYMTVCLCLPFVLLAEDDDPDEASPSPDEDAAAVETVTDPGFERFKTILDRMPFGRPPPGFNPDAPSGSVEGKRGAEELAEEAAEAEANEIEQQIISSVRVSMLNRTADGRFFVGFTDSSVQPAKNYLLELGEKREQCEWQVVGADPDNREVTLSKGGVEATLKVGGGAGSSDDKKKDGGEGEKVAARPGPLRGRLPPRPPVAEAEEGEERKMSALDRVRARRQRNLEMQQAEMEQRRQVEEQARREREQEKKEREMAAEERKAQLDQLMQIQEELRRQREEKQAERERRAAEEAPGGEQETVEE